MKVYLGADHRGFELKEKLKSRLTAAGYEVDDQGAHSLDPQDDYPDFALKVAQMVTLSPEYRGVLVCGSGMGMDVAANKVRGIRASVVHSEAGALHARTNDNINIIALSADTLTEEEACKIVETFLATPFSGEERHVRRLAKIKAIEDSW